MISHASSRVYLCVGVAQEDVMSPEAVYNNNDQEDFWSAPLGLKHFTTALGQQQ